MRSEALWNYINDVYRKCKLKKIVNQQTKNQTFHLNFLIFYIYVFCSLPWHTDGQDIYRIEAHWLDESSKKKSDFYLK